MRIVLGSLKPGIRELVASAGLKVSAIVPIVRSGQLCYEVEVENLSVLTQAMRDAIKSRLNLEVLEVEV